MTTIASIRARALEIPIATPTRISTRVLGSRHFLLVEVEDSDGGLGFGYSYTGTSGGRAARLIVEEMLAPVVLGAESGDIYGCYERCYAETMLAGRAGIVQRALSALDMSLWDLGAKRAGCALATLLGGSPRLLPAYASGGYYRAGPLSFVDAVRAEIEQNAAAGFSDHKIKIGGIPPEEDAKRVRAAVSAIREGGPSPSTRTMHTATRARRYERFVFSRTQRVSAGSGGSKSRCRPTTFPVTQCSRRRLKRR